jgi:hypothetical protein
VRRYTRNGIRALLLALITPGEFSGPRPVLSYLANRPFRHERFHACSANVGFSIAPLAINQPIFRLDRRCRSNSGCDGHSVPEGRRVRSGLGTSVLVTRSSLPFPWAGPWKNVSNSNTLSSKLDRSRYHGVGNSDPPCISSAKPRGDSQVQAADISKMISPVLTYHLLPVL